jgi:hypothetical protein
MRHAFTFSSSNPIKSKEDLKNKISNQKLQYRPEGQSFPEAIDLSKSSKQRSQNFRSYEEIAKVYTEIKVTKEKYRKLEKELVNKGRTRSLELVAIKCKIEALTATYYALKWVTGEWHDLDVIGSANH